MRVGVQLPEVERVVRWEEYRSMAVAAEESGFDSVWIGDHHLYRDDGREERGPWDAWTLLAAIAASTTRVRLGPLVACTGFARAGLLARRAAAVHEVSAGRLVLGLGAGWNRGEFDAFCVPFDNRASRFIESFEIVRRLLAGERVTVAGEYESVKDAVLLPALSVPPPVLMIGSTGERVLRATLPYVGAWNIWHDWYGNTPEGFAAANERVSALAQSVGADPGGVERTATVFVSLDGGAGDRPHVGVPPLSGSVPSIARRVREFAEAGVDEAILVVSPITEQSIRALAEVVAEVRSA